MGLGVGLKFLGAMTVSTEAGLVISALGFSSSSTFSVLSILDLDDDFLRVPDGLRFDGLRLALVVAGVVVTSASASTMTVVDSGVGKVVVVVVTLRDLPVDFLVVGSSSATTTTSVTSTSTAGSSV